MQNCSYYLHNLIIIIPIYNSLNYHHQQHYWVRIIKLFTNPSKILHETTTTTGQLTRNKQITFKNPVNSNTELNCYIMSKSICHGLLHVQFLNHCEANMSKTLASLVLFNWVNRFKLSIKNSTLYRFQELLFKSKLYYSSTSTTEHMYNPSELNSDVWCSHWMQRGRIRYWHKVDVIKRSYILMMRFLIVWGISSSSSSSHAVQDVEEKAPPLPLVPATSFARKEEELQRREESHCPIVQKKLNNPQGDPNPLTIETIYPFSIIITT